MLNTFVMRRDLGECRGDSRQAVITLEGGRTMRNSTWRFVTAVILGAIVLSSSVFAKQVKLDVSLANPVLIEGKKQTTYLKIGLTGFEMAGDTERTPANVAIVLDKSGSMQGDKIKKAREAALMVIDQLSSQDIVSVVAYDNSVSVLVPATKASDKAAIRAGINRLSAGGSTALFAGVSKGASEVRKFLAKNRVNRVILLSDGLANVGPDSPGELAALGASIIKEGISVTTIGLGLGYNEDLMTQLAQRSDGNSYFAETTKDLTRLFKAEFGDVLSVVAQELVIKVHCADGIRPVRTIGRDADISAGSATAFINQIYSSQQKYLLLEVELPAGHKGKTMDVAKVSVSYANMETKTTDTLSSTIAARFTDSEEKVADSVNRDAMIATVTQLATEKNDLAVVLRDKGDIEAARKLLVDNGKFLATNAVILESAKLKEYSGANFSDADNLDEANWGRQRKSMRGWQMFNEQQQLSR